MMFFENAISSPDIIDMAVNTMNKIGRNLFQSEEYEEKEKDEIDTSKKNNEIKN